MHCANRISKINEINSCICKLDQTKHGNMSLSRIIHIIKRNTYNLIKYIEQETGYDGEEIINILMLQQMSKWQRKLSDACYERKRPWNNTCRRKDSLPSYRLNFNCRFHIASCPHTQRIQQEIKKEINEVQLDKKLVDYFSNHLLSDDLIEQIMMYYCIKWVTIAENKPNYLISHYRQCLNWIKHTKSISSAKFYEIELIPALLDVRSINYPHWWAHTMDMRHVPAVWDICLADMIHENTKRKEELLANRIIDLERVLINPVNIHWIEKKKVGDREGNVITIDSTYQFGEGGQVTCAAAAHKRGIMCVRNIKRNGYIQNRYKYFVKIAKRNNHIPNKYR